MRARCLSLVENFDKRDKFYRGETTLPEARDQGRRRRGGAHESTLHKMRAAENAEIGFKAGLRSSLY